MTLHRSEDPAKQRVLREVFNWGRERFSKKPAKPLPMEFRNVVVFGKRPPGRLYRERW